MVSNQNFLIRHNNLSALAQKKKKKKKKNITLKTQMIKLQKYKVKETLLRNLYRNDTNGLTS